MISAWKSFFINIFNFKHRSSRSEFWWVKGIIMLISFFVMLVSILFIMNKAITLVSNVDEETMRRFLVSIENNPTIVLTGIKDYQDPIFSIPAIASFLITIKNVSLAVQLFSFIVFVATLSLIVRRYRDVGFSKKGIIIVLVGGFLLRTIIQNLLISLIITIMTDIVIPSYKSDKFANYNEQSPLKSLFR